MTETEIARRIAELPLEKRALLFQQLQKQVEEAQKVAAESRADAGRYWKLALSLADAETVDINGMEAATGSDRLDTKSGERDIRLVAVRHPSGHIYRFIFLTKPELTRALARDLQLTTYSFRSLNAAEAAFELNQVPEALTYINAIRERAGFGANSLTSDKLSMDRIRNERRAELAFEDHRLWDLKRWRIAHQLWTADRNNPNDMLYALYPYRVYRPGHATHDKYIFVKMVAPRFVTPRFFQLGNYYSSIAQDVINNNPKITVRNPFH